MRSSIACSRCRRSKVKCVNNGVNTTCRACENTGRECTYPSPALTGGQAHHVRREGGSTSTDGTPTNEPSRRPRAKKPVVPPATQHTHSPSSVRALVDALDTSLLTPRVWIELFDIYQQHFATDMPFLHPPTFLKPLRQAGAMQQPPANNYAATANPSPVLPDLSPLLLLSFLALTARYHPTLVAHHSPPSSSRPSNPIIASEYYAAAAKSRIAGSSGDGLESPDVERVQALLMLSLFHWGNCQGSKAWISLGVALRYAQMLGLQYEDELDDQPMALTQKIKQETVPPGPSGRAWETTNKSETFVEREIKRRIFWSCFIMDRYLSSGKYRPQMIHTHDVRIQLPSSERAFLFGEKVRTLLLDEGANQQGRSELEAQSRNSEVPLTNGERGWSSYTHQSPRLKQEDTTSDAGKGRWEVGPDEGLTSRFVKVLEIYGKIVKWSCAGGRRTEKLPPWDSYSSFRQLLQMVRTFEDSLPREMTFSPANTSAHITGRTSTPYTLLHITILLCNIVLHRESIPFVPLRCSRPEGPLDPPIFASDRYSVPSNFWADSAMQLFKCARDLMDLVKTCQEWGVLVETPIVGFAIYTAAAVGVYAINFPWMDQYGYMSSNNEPRAISGGTEAARKALELIGHMRPRLKMADGWFRTIARTHVYYMRLKRDFRKNVKALAARGGSLEQVQKELSLRDGGTGGGGEAWQVIQKTMLEFGSLKDEDLEMSDAPPLGFNGPPTQQPDTTSLRKSVSPEAGMVKQGGWASINAAPSGPTSAHRSSDASNISSQAGTNGLYNTSVSIGKQTGFSTPGLTSPTGQSHSTNGAATPTSSVQGYAVQPPVGSGPGSNAFNRETIGFASVEDARNASMSLQQQMSAPTQQPANMPSKQQPWTEEMEHEWLASLETRFGGDDLAAFVEGFEWSEWPELAAKNGNGTWLSTIWS